jgi:hypothetical protein
MQITFSFIHRMDIYHFSSTNRESDTGSFNNKQYLDGGFRIRKRHVIELAPEVGLWSIIKKQTNQRNQANECCIAVDVYTCPIVDHTMMSSQYRSNLIHRPYSVAAFFCRLQRFDGLTRLVNDASNRKASTQASSLFCALTSLSHSLLNSIVNRFFGCVRLAI